MQSEVEEKKQLTKKDILKEAVGTVLYFLGVLIVALLIVKFVVQRTMVDGESMEPTLYHGENLMVDKLSYRFGEPKRFDIIVLKPYENDKKTFYIKRIIALPGEKIKIDANGTIYINGEKLYEGYGKEVIRPENRGRAAVEVTMGENEYFVMGDNRNNSGDSRSDAVGNVKKEDIIGKAWLRIWPLNKFGLIKKK
ncbi:MAG: signal peptidase I [Lachnospiraceae bacterium]|nr:signal peptidase I [Lachnospiraceae bacterium]